MLYGKTQRVLDHLQLTAANTNDQVDVLLVVLDELADREVLRTGP